MTCILLTSTKVLTHSTNQLSSGHAYDHKLFDNNSNTNNHVGLYNYAARE